MKGNNEEQVGLERSSDSATSSAVSRQVGKDVLTALESLEKLKNMDVKFFENDVFRQLRPSNQKVPSIPSGRTNPFAPVGSGGAFTATTSGAVR